MANPYPALITDANSETRVAGQITFTDPANQPGGSTGFEHASILSTSVAPGGTNLSFGHDNGDALLDYSDPAFPSVIADGTYAFQATVVCSDGEQVGKSFTAYGGISDGVVVVSATTGAEPLRSIGGGLPQVSILLGIGRQTVAGAGGPAMGVTHDNLSNLNFVGDLYITRLS